MDKKEFTERFAADLHSLGVRVGGVLLVHSSLKSLGFVPDGAETIIQALQTFLGHNGTLLMPALTYETVRSSNPTFNILTTPSCVGIIPEAYRLGSGSKRSLHPTHSVCVTGPLSDEFIHPHQFDNTPCGPNSPFRRLPDFNGQILMLGCGLLPNTSMHAIEEIVGVPYLLKSPMQYTLYNEEGEEINKAYTPHNFVGWQQRYDRVAHVINSPDLQTGFVLASHSYLLEASSFKENALKALLNNPYYFVDPISRQ